jgi:flagellin
MTAYENVQASESRIRDADMAEEMVEFSKNTILVHTGSAMLAQANIHGQSVLKLLGA